MGDMGDMGDEVAGSAVRASARTFLLLKVDRQRFGGGGPSQF
jgi:hypothetical protein